MTSTSRVLRALAPRQIATLTLFLLATFMLTVSQPQARHLRIEEHRFMEPQLSQIDLFQRQRVQRILRDAGKIVRGQEKRRSP